MVEVTQRDRNAAADWLRTQVDDDDLENRAYLIQVRVGGADESSLVQAFARHRVETLRLADHINDEDNDWANVEPTDGCWLWKGALTDRGYAMLSRKRGSHLALELHGKPRPGRALALHSCDNPRPTPLQTEEDLIVAPSDQELTVEQRELLPVTQADRQATHDYLLSIGIPTAETLAGANDSGALVQAFAAHRQSSPPAQSELTEDLWMGLAASFGPVLREAFPEHSAIERMHVADALCAEVRKREHWFKLPGKE